MEIISMTDSFFPQGFLTELRQPTRTTDVDGKRLPRISIVMPSFNQAQFIERSSLSVLNQGYPDLQFIVIDGGSSDGTVDIIKKYEFAIDFWVSEPDEGQSAALNKGFSRANGVDVGWVSAQRVTQHNQNVGLRPTA
jgi:cellulose synthase/poly-beta-1,6-N-acetylglucosamine synthase-like glycosyltransferase